jgi:hypothetical protein
MVLAYPGTLYIAAPLGGTALLITLFQHSGAGPVARLLLFNVLSALLFLALYSPQIPQLLAYLSEERTRGPMGIPWLLNFLALLGTGSLWASPDPAHPLITDLITTSPDRWLGTAIAFIAIPLLMVIGLASTSRYSRVASLLYSGAILSIVLGCTHCAAAGRFIYLWYLIVPLPVIFLASAWGVAAATNGRGSSPKMASLVFLLVFAIFAAATHRSREIVMAHSKAPLLPALRLVYGDTRPHDLDKRIALTAGFWMEAPVHDPWFIHTGEIEDYERLIEAARRENMPMYVFFQHVLAEVHSPHLVDFIQNSGHFEEAGIFHGLEEPQFTERVFRLKEL